MSTGETVPLLREEKEPPVGTYCPAGPNDLRSSCPMINSLANHGYLPRDGRYVTPHHLRRGLYETGLSWFLCMTIVKIIMGERVNDDDDNNRPAPTTWFTKIRAALTKPLKNLFRCQLRPRGQIDPITGQKALHLDQVAEPGLIEHDVSLSRLDHSQGNHLVRQPDLIAALLACSSDGGETISVADLCAHRLRRIHHQRLTNPAVMYGKFEHNGSCAEISLLTNVLGDGERVRCDYVRALFEEERLPHREGWSKKSSWWQKIGLWRLRKTSAMAKKLTGLTF